MRELRLDLNRLSSNELECFLILMRAKERQEKEDEERMKRFEEEHDLPAPPLNLEDDTED